MQGLADIMRRIERSGSSDSTSSNKDNFKTSPREKMTDTLPPLSENRLKNQNLPSQRPQRYSISELKNDVRRPSVSSNSTSGRRPSIVNNPSKRFKSIGSRVTNMLKVKMAFQKKGDGGKEDDNNPIIKITQLPKEPRFCSTLSPEAQFAMMKGYEDTVYGYLCRSYPEYKFLLRRSRTPVSISKIGDQPFDCKTVSGNKDIEGDGFGDEDEFSNVQRSSSGNNTMKKQSHNTNLHARSNSRTNRLRSTPVTSDQKLHFRTGLPRSNSLPVLVPRERQLIMTYRLQSAMDILDTVRSKMGLQSLSPRIKSYPGEIKPVTDFNKWTSVWSREFQEKPTAAKC